MYNLKWFRKCIQDKTVNPASDKFSFRIMEYFTLQSIIWNVVYQMTMANYDDQNLATWMTPCGRPDVLYVFRNSGYTTRYDMFCGFITQLNWVNRLSTAPYLVKHNHKLVQICNLVLGDTFVESKYYRSIIRYCMRYKNNLHL